MLFYTFFQLNRIVYFWNSLPVRSFERTIPYKKFTRSATSMVIFDVILQVGEVGML